MTRNGLLPLIAVLLALALVVRLENTAQAQISYWDYSNPWDPGYDPLAPPTLVDLGATVTIGNSLPLNGRPAGTYITGHSLAPFIPGRPTYDHPTTVFINSGYSVINAAGPGAVISSIGYDATGLYAAPAILNGADTMTIEEVNRVYQIRVTRMEFGWQLTWGYYLASDPFQVWTMCQDEEDELSGNIQDYELPLLDGTTQELWIDSPTANLPAGYELSGLLNPNGTPLQPGDTVYLPNIGFTVTNPANENYFASIPPAANYDNLPPIDIPNGIVTTGSLVINQRNSMDPTARRFSGDDRTLIQNMGGPTGVIENHGTLTVNDAIIRTSDEFGSVLGGVGIYHEYSRSWILNDDLDAVTGYGSGYFGETVVLNNTQIGSPSGGYSYIIGYYFDQDTGELVYVYDTSASGNGVPVNRNGTPSQMVTRIFADDTIQADGVNGRIIAGQNVTLKRNTVGSIFHTVGSTTGTFAEAQNVLFHQQYYTGMDIGIHVLAHSFNLLRDEQVYFNSRYYVNDYYIPGMMGTSSYGTLYNQIQLNDNSWIFAGTGIAFGNTETFAGDGAIRISIDSTSGIYSPGYGSLSPMTPSMASTTGGYMGYGITDRFSLMNLWVTNGTTTYLLDYTTYSGSFHEILVEGKVITGAPSQAGIQFSFGDLSGMSASDRAKLSGVYYYDPDDPDADWWGNVYYSETTASKFVAFNSQPNRVFWIKIDGRDPEPLTYYDYEAQRWKVHPNASNVRINTGVYASRDSLPFFTAFDSSHGVGIDVVGTSMAWEGTVLPAGVAPWSVYYGPTVRLITALGNDALITGGQAHLGMGAAMSFADQAHVASVIIGENNDVKNLSNLLFVSSGDTFGSPAIMIDFKQSAKNYQAFDMMTSVKRGKFLYDPNLLYIDESLGDDLTPDGQGNYPSNRFHLDNAGVHGDILSHYNAVAYMFGGSGTRADGTGWSLTYLGNTMAFWMHGHPGVSYYNDEVLDIGSTDGSGLGTTSQEWLNVLNRYALVPLTDTDRNPSYIMGHRDYVGNGYSAAGGGGWTASDIPGRSLILDEVLLNFLAGNRDNYDLIPSQANPTISVPNAVNASFAYSYGYADNARHYREALARFIHLDPYAETYSGLTTAELLAGYTRDGTLVVFTNGDIFSGNIYGGGFGDNYRTRILGAGGGLYSNPLLYPGISDGYILDVINDGNIDLRFVDGTTIFNRNIMEVVNGSDIYRGPGIRVRDVYIEKTGHLMLNDAEFAVNPFASMSEDSYDYASRLLIHDVLNEGIVSGNGTFQIAQRRDLETNTDYFEGYFINRGILAPGLAGFVGEDEYQAREIEKTAYWTMLNTVSNSSGDTLWQQLDRGVPGGQYGVINIFGSLRLMDEHVRPVIDPYNPLYNTDERLNAGEYHATIGNDTIADIFSKYVATIANATSTRINVLRPDGTVTVDYDNSVLPAGEISKEDWQTIAVEKLGTHLSWFSPAAMVDKKTGLPLLTKYEQFEYMTDPARRAQLQRQMVVAVLTPTELRAYDNDPVQRARLNQRLFDENNIRFELTQLDGFLMRYGFSDVVSVYGTIPPYWYAREGWGNMLHNQGNVLPSSITNNKLLGVTQLGGVVQADRIYDMDVDAHLKERLTSFIIIASEGYTDGSVKAVTSATTDWVFANVDVMPVRMESGQLPAVLTVIDDPHYYLNRVRRGGDSFNARSVANTLDNAMFTNPGLAMAFQFGLNSPEVLNDVFRQVASGTRSNSVVMNLWSPSDNLFNQIGYGTGGLSTGNRGNVVYRNMQTGQLQQPYGQPAVPPPGTQFAPPMGQTRGQSPFHRTGSVWGAYLHSNFSMGDDDNSYKYTFYRNGAVVGNEWNLTPSSVLGAAFTFNQGELKSFADRVDSTDYTFGLYFVAAPFEQFELKSYLGGGYQTYKMDRYIRNNDVFIGYHPGNAAYGANGIFGIDEHYNAETRGHSFDWAIEFARPFTMNPNFVIRPAAGFEYQAIQQNAYSDRKSMGSTQTSWSNNGTNMAEAHLAQGATSGTFGMDYKKMTFARSLVRFGVNTESYFARGGWRFRGYYVHRLTGDRYPISEQSFTSGSKVFEVRGGELGTSYCQVGSGLHFWLNRDRTATLFMNGDWNFSLKNRGYSMLSVDFGVQQNF